MFKREVAKSRAPSSNQIKWNDIPETMKPNRPFFIVVMLMASLVVSAQLKPEFQFGTTRSGKADAPLTIVIPEVPASVTFAGKKIDLDRVEIGRAHV